MSNEQLRAEFEAWARNKNYDLDTVMLLSKPPKFSRYANPATQDAWDAYQSGRAALQSPDIQERIRDGERLEWLAENINEIEVYRSQRGWCVVEKGITHSIVEVYKTLRGALDAAMEKQP